MTEGEQQQRDWTHLPGGELLHATIRRITKLRDLLRFRAVDKLSLPNLKNNIATAANMPEEEQQQQQQRDWTHLPGDLLHTIIRRFTNLPDIIRFQAVSKPWRAAVLDEEQNPPKFRQTLPWQIWPCRNHPATAAACDGGDNCYRFVDVAENNKCRLHVDFPPTVTCHGSALGWLLLLDSPVLYLWNPLAKTNIPLANKIAGQESNKYLCVAQLTLTRFAMSAEPTSRTGCHVVVTYVDRHGEGGLLSWKLGGRRSGEQYQSWCRMIPFRSLAGDPTLTRGRSDVVFWRGELHVLALPDGLGDCCYSYFVVSPEGGELMLLSRHERIRDRVLTVSFRLHKINEDEKRWDEVKTIGGDWAFFMDSRNAFCASVKNHPEFRSHCVYYHDRVYDLFNSLTDRGNSTRPSGQCLAWILPSNC